MGNEGEFRYPMSGEGEVRFHMTIGARQRKARLQEALQRAVGGTLSSH